MSNQCEDSDISDVKYGKSRISVSDIELFKDAAGGLWFRAKDINRALNMAHSWVSNLISESFLKKGEYRHSKSERSSGCGDCLYVSESALDRLVERAEATKGATHSEWVFECFLPTVHQHVKLFSMPAEDCLEEGDGRQEGVVFKCSFSDSDYFMDRNGMWLQKNNIARCLNADSNHWYRYVKKNERKERKIDGKGNAQAYYSYSAFLRLLGALTGNSNAALYRRWLIEEVRPSVLASPDGRVEMKISLHEYLEHLWRTSLGQPRASSSELEEMLEKERKRADDAESCLLDITERAEKAESDCEELGEACRKFKEKYVGLKDMFDSLKSKYNDAMKLVRVSDIPWLDVYFSRGRTKEETKEFYMAMGSALTSYSLWGGFPIVRHEYTDRYGKKNHYNTYSPEAIGKFRRDVVDKCRYGGVLAKYRKPQKVEFML